MKRILVIEDDVMMNSGICYNLELDQYYAVPAHNAAAALDNKPENVQFNSSGALAAS